MKFLLFGIRMSFVLSIYCLAPYNIVAQEVELPPNYPKAQYDESKVPFFTLPDPLVMINEEKVTDIKTWEEQRRPEIIELFQNYVYGKTMVGKPEEMTWEIISSDSDALHGEATCKLVRIYFSEKKDGPKMDINLTLPNNINKPVPVFIIPFPKNISDNIKIDISKFKGDPEIIIKNGYGLVNFDPTEVEPDKPEDYNKGIRKFYSEPGQIESKPGEWGAIGAWAWSFSRVMDYLITDPDIDSKKVIITGYSRYGKAAMWAAAQDQRFALIISGQSGTGGVVIVRRKFGETIEKANEAFPHWFTSTFKEYNDNVNALPVDWHMLVALIAPRPIYIETAQLELWGDPRGSFLAGKNAEPIYKLYGKEGLKVDSMPPVNTPVGGSIGFHMREGGHMLGYTEYDWDQFLKFAKKHLK